MEILQLIHACDFIHSWNFSIFILAFSIKLLLNSFGLLYNGYGECNFCIVGLKEQRKTLGLNRVRKTVAKTRNSVCYWSDDKNCHYSLTKTLC